MGCGWCGRCTAAWERDDDDGDDGDSTIEADDDAEPIDRCEGDMTFFDHAADLAREANPTTKPYEDERLIKAAPALLYAAKYALNAYLGVPRYENVPRPVMAEAMRCLQAAIAAAECNES